MADPLVTVTDLTHRYPDGTLSLDALSCSIPHHARLALLGPNGAGKSTLLLHLNGINLPQSGRVHIGGRSITRQDHRWAAAEVGLVFQDPDDQLFCPTVWEDVLFGPLQLGLGPHEARERAATALEAVGLSGIAEKPPQHLSLGQRRLAAIAAVLAMRPSLLVLDEPTAYLDPRATRSLLGLLDRLHAEGVALVMATHDVDLAAEWAESVLVLREGRVVAEGDRQLLAEAEVMEKAGLAVPRLARAFAGFTPDPPLTVEEARARLRESLG